jgi:hypothetical protein
MITKQDLQEELLRSKKSLEEALIKINERLNLLDQLDLKAAG